MKITKKDEKLMQEKEFILMKENLTKAFNTEPSINDIKWGVYNSRKLDFAVKGQWGLYVNNLLDMAFLLKKEGKEERALSLFLQIFYLDLNGPNNLSESGDNREAFEPENGFIAPKILQTIQKLSLKLGLSEEDTKKMFYEVNKKEKIFKEMPLSIEKAYEQLIKASS